MKSKLRPGHLVATIAVIVTSLLALVFQQDRTSIRETNHNFRLEIARKSAELLHANQQILRNQKVIDSLSGHILELGREKELLSRVNDSILGAYLDTQQIILTLDSILYENNHPSFNLSDSSHIHLFFKWTTPNR